MEKKENFECEFCGETFELFCFRKKHLKEEHDSFHPNVLEYQCAICGTPYGSHSNMKDCFHSHPESQQEMVGEKLITDDLM